MSVKRILTERLILVPGEYNIVTSLLKGEKNEIENLGFKSSSKWPRNDTLDILEVLSQVMNKSDEIKGYGLWIIVKKTDMTIIGDAGFTGEPNENGEVEIGYGLIEDEWRKGYGFEAVNALVNWALSRNEIKAVKADCLINNIGSIRILQKVGMSEIGRDNELIYWEIR